MNFDRLLFTYLYEATPPWFALPITYLGTWGSLWILISVVLIACDRGPRRRTTSRSSQSCRECVRARCSISTCTTR